MRFRHLSQSSSAFEEVCTGLKGAAMNGRHDSIARLLFEVDTRPGVHQMCGEAVLHFWKQKEEKKTKQKSR